MVDFCSSEEELEVLSNGTSEGSDFETDMYNEKYIGDYVEAENSKNQNSKKGEKIHGSQPKNSKKAIVDDQNSKKEQSSEKESPEKKKV